MKLREGAARLLHPTRSHLSAALFVGDEDERSAERDGAVRVAAGRGGRRRWTEGVPGGGAGAAVTVLHLPALRRHAHLLAQVQEDLTPPSSSSLSLKLNFFFLLGLSETKLTLHRNHLYIHTCSCLSIPLQIN